MILLAINEIKYYLEEKIQEENYKLAQFNVKNVHETKTVLPKVATGNLPHQNFNLYNAPDLFFQAPYVLIGFDEEDDSMQDSKISILIQVCCYSSTCYDENGTIPDNKAFEDCILFLEWIRNKIIKKWNFAGLPIDGMFKIGSYDSKELTYPYSFGYVSFSLEQKEVTINRAELYKD